MYKLDRFVKAQMGEGYNVPYSAALAEIQRGRKVSHWIWYIFPQLKGLGRSSTSDYYGISGIEEAKAYMEHPLLRQHLLEITQALLDLKTNDPRKVVGWDDMKLHSSMTLFALAAPECEVFEKVLEKYFFGRMDQ